MVKSCLVATCKNTQGIPGITFHKIGKKRYSNRLRAIGRSTDENLSPQNVICSKHFADEDFIYFNGKKYLRLEALPRLFLPRRPQIIENKTDIMKNTISRMTPGKYIPMWTFLILSAPPVDNIDLELNQTNLSVYPTNDFFSVFKFRQLRY
ncbi:hypothetical protein NQ317_003076 [Molorchus minor]|uniref:THAP-type domain-containing protein n=1 Tax=Molorchus minor TaxID=1323400 RepID=A0ABQ9JN73_9CUCU|nr:hypothetical protein NQ317_003076 [Molorchus minor]